MKTKGAVCLLAIIGSLNLLNKADAYYYDNFYSPQINPYFTTNQKYNHLYANPPKRNFYGYGRYIMSSSRTRYVHSPSRLKGVRHAARINAYNMQAMGY